MVNPTFFGKLDALSLQLKRNAFGKYQGEQQTVYAGDGLTFKDFSPYTVGDDFRRIDWRIYARTKELFIKRFESDRNLVLHILIDGSASMAYGDKDSKFQYASTLGLGVAHIAAKNNDRTEISVFDTDVYRIKGQHEQKRIPSLIKTIDSVSTKGKTDLDTVMKKYQSRVKTKSLFFLFSDFLYPVETLHKLLDHFGKSQIFLVQVLHKDEIDLPFSGPNKFVDPEDEEKKVNSHVSPRMKSIYAEAMHEHKQTIIEACKGHRAKFIEVSTKELPIHGFLELWKFLI